MSKRRRLVVLVSLAAAGAVRAAGLADAVKPYVGVDAPVVALAHLRVIDGTGAPPRLDQTLVLSGGRIQALGDSKAVKVPTGAKVLALDGATVIPGLVGMHDHLFMTAYRTSTGPLLLTQATRTFPRLYLAGGVTTIRTSGSIEPYADLNAKRLIDEGQMPGPKVFVTGPYLEGAGSPFLQLHPLTGPEDATRLVEYWAGQGVTSFKAYMNLTREELVAAVKAAHARGLKVTGHLCTIGFRDATAAGIDNVEHGFLYDSDFVPGRAGDTCPPRDAWEKAFAQLDVSSPEVKDALEDLVRHHVAVTSTLAVFEQTYRAEIPPLVLELLSPDAREAFLRSKLRAANNVQAQASMRAAVKKDMELERAFVKAGGLLVTGADPTGMGGVLAGLADQRGVELLVEAGFAPVEAIHIATQNGAELLGEGARIGTLSPGKQADLVVLRGDPSTRIEDIEKVEWVFKDGIGYDPAKLLDSVRGQVGQ